MAALGLMVNTLLDTDAAQSTPKSVQECLANTSQALNSLQKRKDIDSIYLHFEFLLVHSIRRQLSDLFKRNDRPWRVELVFHSPNLPPTMDKLQLQTVLSILQPVRYLSLRYVPPKTRIEEPLVLDKNVERLVLQCLPRFDHLNCLDLQDWGDQDQHELKDHHNILHQNDSPSLSRFTRLSFAPQSQSSIQDPMIDPSTACQLRSIKVDLDLNTVDKESFQTALAILRMVPNLPLLEDLYVEMPTGAQNKDRMISTLLSTWMETPQCLLTHLTMSIEYPYQLFALLDILPNMRLLQSLTLNYHGDRNLLLEPLLQAVADSPSIQHLGFEYECSLDLVAARRLLKFVLDCRPRLLSIWIHPEATIDEESRDDIAFVSHVHHELMLVQQYTQGEKPIPMSRWPLLLAKLSSNFHYATNHYTDAIQRKNPAPGSVWPSLLATLGYNTKHALSTQLQDAGSIVSLDALFGVMKQVLPRHAASLATTHDIRWNVSVVDVEFGYPNLPKEWIATM